MPGKPESSGRAQQVAAQASSGRGDDEHVSERTGEVRERTRAGDNEGVSRMGERMNYHNNAIQAWSVAASGEVGNVFA